MKASLAPLVVLALVGCQKPTHIAITPKQPLLKSKTDSVQLVGRIMMNRYEDATLHPTWSSKDEKIAVVGPDGKASCKAGGRVDLIATYGELTATVPIECLFVESLRADTQTVELSFESGDPKKVTVESIGYDGRPIKDRTPFFRPQNEKICRVDARGQFWPVEKGATVVVAEVDEQRLEIACVVK